MSVDRLERVNVLVRREIAEAIPAVMSSTGIDLASVMVSNVRVASNLRNATVSISILGHEKDLKYTPVLQFVLDESVEKGDHVLDVLSKMEQAGEIPPEEG